MIAFELEQALRELEQTTEKLAETTPSDLGALCRALEDRANAITRLSLIASSARPLAGASTVERLADVLVRGEEATRRLVQVRREESEEWISLSRLRRSLESQQVPMDPSFDCEG